MNRKKMAVHEPNINGYIFIAIRCSRLITIIFTFDLISFDNYRVTTKV